MKKLLAIILAAVMMLSMTGCGYTTTTNTNTNPNTNTDNNIDDTDTTVDVPPEPEHIEHVGKGSCSVCGIDYYDELANYIKQNHNSTAYDGSYQIDTTDKYDYYSSMVTLNDDHIFFYCSNYLEAMSIAIYKSDIKNGSYDWSFRYTDKKGFHPYVKGTLDVSKLTNSIDFDRDYFEDEEYPSYNQHVAERLADHIIFELFIGMINNLGNNITPAHFGFERLG